MSDSRHEVINRCGFCGEIFQINRSDPHWSTGRGPLCPNRPPSVVPALIEADLLPTAHDHVVKHVARCRRHNTIRAHTDEPCWKCWHERRTSMHETSDPKEIG